MEVRRGKVSNVYMSVSDPRSGEGFTPIPNPVLEALARTRFSGYERNVLDFLFRKTYGWSKPTDVISLSQFVDATGISKSHIVRTINRLVQRNLISKTVAQIGNDKLATYEFNSHYGEWSVLPKQATLPKQAHTIEKRSLVLPSVSVEKEEVLKREPLPKLATLPKQAMTPETAEVLAYLNQKVKSKFRNPGDIPARLKDYSVEDCKKVIDKKCVEWLGTKFAKNLDPMTLFRPSNFDRYLNQVDVKTEYNPNKSATDVHMWDDIKGW